MALLPFFDSPKFRPDGLEEFVARFLNAGLSLAVDGPGGVEERKILRAFRSNKTGGVMEGGVDVVAKIEGGETWGFECKFYTKGKGKWEAGMSKKALKMATYPADRYFLVVIARDYQREAIELVEARDNWEFWDADVLSSQFKQRVGLDQGVGILEEFFGSAAAEQFYGLLRDEVLISRDEFFSPTLKKEHAFNHLAPLIGREELLSALHRFVAASRSKVLLVSACGGEGKSRTLVAFAAEFENRHPSHILRFVNPAAGTTDAEKSLGVLLAEDKRPVIVHEDAHRLETLRPRLLSAAAGSGAAKLIITSRPQSVAAVREELRKYGIRPEDIELAPVPSPLSQAEMIRLAKAVLEPESKVDPHRLAKLSSGSPLICVIGGNLINSEKSLAGMLDSHAFHEEVYSRFAEQNLEPLSDRNPDRKEFLERLLRTIAVLAPCPESGDAFQELADYFDEVRGSLLERRIDELKSAGLVAATEQGLRVAPDLFADHLVFTTCVRDGNASRACEEIVDHFGPSRFPNLLRNLSEAEWRARVAGSTNADLTTPLWDIFLDRFRGSPFRIRREMLASWASFSLFLPEKTLQLTRLALDLDEAPPDDPGEFQAWFLGPVDHKAVVDRVPTILQPLVVHDLERQPEVCDILGPLGVGWSANSEFRVQEKDNHPWVVIGKAASFDWYQPMASVEGVIRWIGSRWNREWMADLVDERETFLSLVLEPVFERAVERAFPTDSRIRYKTFLLPLESTAPAKKAAFDLIEKKVIPRSEIAALNAIPVLHAAATFQNPMLDGDLDRKPWRPDRLRAIELLQACCDVWQSPFVKFAAWRTLAGIVHSETDKAVAAGAKDALAAIPRDLPLEIAFSALGQDGELLMDFDRDDVPSVRESWEWWQEFHPALAARLLEEYPDADRLLVLLSKFGTDARERGFYPNWGLLLGSLVSRCEAFASAAIDQCLGERSTFLDSHFGSLLQSLPNADSEVVDQWLVRAIRSRKPELQQSALNTLQWNADTPGSDIVAAVKNLLRSKNHEEQQLAVRTLSDALRIGRAWATPLIEAVPVSKLEEQNLKTLIAGLVEGCEYRNLQTGIAPLRHLLEGARPVNSLHDAPYPGFLKIVSKAFPGETYRFLKGRIEALGSSQARRDENGDTFQPVPSVIEAWRIPGLDAIPEFPGIVQELSDKIRNTDYPEALYWRDLFVAAVLLNDTAAGTSALRTWLDDADDAETVGEIAKIFSVPGSTMVFREPEFVKDLLEKASTFGTKEEKMIRNQLIVQRGMRIVSNGLLEPEYRWILDEARKAESKHAADPVLSNFYKAVIRWEERDRDWNREENQKQKQMLATVWPTAR